MSTQLSNGLITAKINHKGAELTSLFHLGFQLEYMWNADPKFWGKSSPVLFPIVGALKGGEFIHNGRVYSLPRHGFARDHEFELELKEPTRAIFLLRSSESTRSIYPFEFEFRITYELTGFELEVTYDVRNLSNGSIYFSVGAHPAFKVPLTPGTSYQDYFLKFERKENASRWPISKEGLIETTPQPFFTDQDELPLTHSLFYADALVFKDLKSEQISIRSHKHAHGIDFSFPGFPFFGIWAFRDADFVCLEPWCGVADSVSHDQRLENKEGIVKLDAQGRWAKAWSVKCF